MKTIIEFSKICPLLVHGQNDDPTTRLHRKVFFRVVVARPADILGTVTGPVRADVYELVDGPMNTPVWMRIGHHYVDTIPPRPAALEPESAIGLVMDRLATFATSPDAWKSSITGDTTLIDLGELV